MFLLTIFSISLWTLLAYTLVRLTFLLWNWNLYHTQNGIDLLGAFFYGLRFDISAVSLLSVLPLLAAMLLDCVITRKKWAPLFQKWFQKWISKALIIFFLIFHLPMLFLNFVDIELINFAGRRFTIDAIHQFGEGKAVAYVINGWPLILMVMFVMTIYSIGFSQILKWINKINLIKKTNTFWFYYRTYFLVFILIFTSIRGGWQIKPLNFAHAQIYTLPAMNSLVLNTPFAFLQALFRSPLPKSIYFSDTKEMLKYLNGSLSNPSWIEGKRFKEKQNIILIVLESFGLEYMGSPNGDQGYTPFLDELSQKGILFTNAFSNGRRSIEGIGAIFGGIPALMNQPFISSQYMANYFLGIGTLLEREGYHTSFFHGAKNGSMYFDQFMRTAGIKDFFGLNEYPNQEDHDGTWGIWDEPMFQWMASKLSGFKQPFFSSMFSLTSHHPFVVPDKYQNQFPKGNIEVLQTIGYTDYALRKFFETIEKQPWYKNTLFIITADHTSENFRKEYANELGKYRVPILIYHPRLKFSELNSSQVVSHIDIPATILDFLGFSQKEMNFLGKSVFVPGERSAINYLEGRYFLITKDFFVQYNLGGEYKMYSMKDADQKDPLLEPQEKKENLIQRLKASIQYFSLGLWDNRLYYPIGR